MPNYCGGSYLAKIPAYRFSTELKLAILSGRDCTPFLEALETRKIRDLDFISLIFASKIFSNVKKFVLNKLDQKGEQNFLGLLQILRQQIRLGYLSFVPPDPVVKGSFANPFFAYRIELMIDGENMTTKDLGVGKTITEAKQEAARLFLKDYVLDQLVTPRETDDSAWDKTY